MMRRVPFYIGVVMNIDFIAAAESHYKAKMDEAALTMRVYMGSSVGVGDHPEFFSEFRKSLESFKEARENFQVVQELKGQYLKSQEGTEGKEEEKDED
jgi:hypothetical protein|tara:strand:+ start:1494 stop:1787 length:294 start_codon:yes stop_codon:yes gene_type:complete